MTAGAQPPSDSGASVKPVVDLPDGPPSGYLDLTDLSVGDGAEATKGATAVVHYVGVCLSTREQFDASYDRGETFEFALGERQVIPGWDTGVRGMRVGGRRRLVIPSHLAYGARGVPGVIGPGETLVFVVDLVDVR